MGATVHYRGTLADPSRVEDFEDRVIDLALELGGMAKIWRSASDDQPPRVVRGVMLDLSPGQETTSLLVSPEGWLIGLVDIEDAEQGRLEGPPWCFVKTQFGSVEGHVALVEMLAALKREFMPDLEVSDEGGYWETRDLSALTRNMARVQKAIDTLAEHLRQDGLSAEAAEDPEILATRIERIARLVHKTLSRPAEHPLVHWDDDDDSPETEAQWDAMFKEDRRRQERMQRTIEESLARGEDHEEAFDRAMLEETAAGLPEEPSDEQSPPEWDQWTDWDDLEDADEDEEDEAWRESIPEEARDREDRMLDRERHPLLQRAMDLLARLHELLGPGSLESSPALGILYGGAGDIMGGLAQAVVSEEHTEAWGLAIVQLKRSLRGAAFALGALFSLRSEGTLEQAEFDELRATIRGIQSDVFAELRQVRERFRGEE